MTPFSASSFDFEFLQGSQSVPVAERVLVVVLHGKGDRLDAYRAIDREFDLGEFDFLLLNGPKKLGDGYRWMLDEPRHEPSLSVTRDQLFVLLDEILEHGYKAQNILWLGHSQGGRVAADLVMHAPMTFMGLIGISSYVGFFPGWKTLGDESSTGESAGVRGEGAWKTPWLFTHGTEDNVIPLAEIRGHVRELLRARIPLTYREFPKGHDFDFEREVPFVRQWIVELCQKRNQQRDHRVKTKTPSHRSEMPWRRSLDL